MTQGFLLFAHDNERISYGQLAVWCAQRIHQYLDRPVSLVADPTTVDNIIAAGLDINVFDHVITSSSTTQQVKSYQGEMLTFQNLDRVSAWDLTPYDETIIIDTDIVIQSKKLNLLWGSAHDYMVCRDARDVFGHPHPDFDWVSTTGVKFFWATEFYFRKTEKSHLFFKTCKWVKEHYPWLSVLHQYNVNLLRNDYIWSIALHMLGGTAHANWCPVIPGELLYVIDKSNLESMTKEQIVLSHTAGKHVCRIRGQDVHVMNKNDLQRLVRQELGVGNE